MSSAMKFLHGSDFHLDQPITGLSDIPAHLKETLANAPYNAAERFFDTAINERVDFVLLAGDVVDLDKGGPRAAAFLLGQFERLADKEIEVYWCGGESDQLDRWPNAVEMPDNVTTFPSSLVEHAAHKKDGKTIATIVGSGLDHNRRNATDFRCTDDTPFPIAIAHGPLDSTSIASQNIRYWALGGKHKRAASDKTSSIAVYPGTTQSRSPSEPGPHGCTLVVVDAAGKMRVQGMELDSVRWSLQKITVAENAKLEQLKDYLSDRCMKIRSEYPDQLVLVKWKIATTGDFNTNLRNADWHKDLMTWLRHEFGQATGGLWTVTFEIDPPRALPAEWYEEETILGDYLRAIGRHQGDSSMGLSLLDYIPDEQMVDPQNEDHEDWLTELARIPADKREAILKKASLLGVDYLARHDSEALEVI